MKTLLPLVAALTAGCATNLSHLQTAKTLDPKGVRISAGVGVYIPASQAITAVTEGIALGARATEAVAKNEPFSFTAKDEETLITSAMSLALYPPSALFDLNVRVGIVKDLEVGLGYRTNAVRADVKYRLYHRPHGAAEGFAEPSTDVALTAGAARYLFSNPVFDILGYARLDRFDRWDLDGALTVSHDINRYVSVYGAGRYDFSHTTLDETLVRLSYDGSAWLRTDVAIPAQVDAHFIGATAGLRVGISQLSLFLELTAGATLAPARALGTTRQLGGLTVYPAAGLATAF